MSKTKEKVKTNIFKITDTETGKVHYMGRYYITELAKQREITAPTLKELEKKLTTEKNKYNNGILPSNTSLTLEKMILDTLFVYKQNKLKPSSIERYYGIYKKYIKGTQLSKKNINKLQVRDLQLFYNNILKDKGKENIVININKLVKASLTQAVKLELISRNVASLVTLPSINKNKKIQIFSDNEIHRLMDTLKKEDLQLQLIVLIAITTGMRQGEILGLTWNNIDLDNNIIKIRQTVKQVKKLEIKDGQIKEGKNEIIKTKPKVDSSIRDVFLPKEVCNLLKTHEQNRINNIVFPNSFGGWIDASNFRKHYKNLLKKADIPYLKFHTLRHQYTSTLLKNNVLLKRVQELLGHATPTTTMNIYMQLSSDDIQTTNTQINNIFSSLL